MAQCIHELLQIEFDSATVLEGNLKKEVTDTVIKSCNLVQNFLKKCCIPQNEVEKNISSTCSFSNKEDIDLKQLLSENCSQLNFKSTLNSKLNLCLPNYISEETIGRWCTACLKETLYVAMFPCIMKLSHETDSISSKKEKNSCSEEPSSCSGFKSNGDVYNSSGNEKPSSEVNDVPSRFPLQGQRANVEEDSLELTSVSKNGTPSLHFLDISSLHGSLTTTSASSRSICSKTMTSAVVKANALMDFCWQKLNTGNWKDIAIHWRQLYTWSCVVQVSLLLQCVLCDLQIPGRKITTIAASVAQVVRVADLGLLMGAPLESSPLALCASLLNSIARLSLSAQERGVPEQGGSFNPSEERNLSDGVSLSSEKDFTAETIRDLPLGAANFVSKREFAQKGDEPGKTGILIKEELEYLRDKSSLNGSKDFSFRKTRDLSFGTSSSGKGGEVVDTPQKTGGPQVNLLTHEKEFVSNTTPDNTLVPSGITQLSRLKSTSFSDQSKIMLSKSPTSTSCITISCPDNDNETKSTKENFFSPLNELPFESLLRKKLCALHLPPVTDFYMKHFLKEEPVKLLGVLDFWPAMKKWSPEYLRRLAGARTVPIEVGARYTDSDWSQELVTLDTYITRYMGTQTTGPPGYLAQHQLLDQIPELLEDIRVPDYCHLGSAEEPRVNAWIGPKGTVSPLHHDPDHNILAQVVGYKYVRLYPASETPRLYPHPDPLLSNTSRVDVEGDTSEFPEFKGAIFWDMILRPGDSVYIPPKCWHYVRSLSVSFSVSFWWT